MSAEFCNVYPKAKSNIVRMDADGETILYDQATMRTHVLTETAAIVFAQCDGKNSVDDIKAHLAARNSNVAEDVTLVSLHRLAKVGLISGFAQKPWESPTTRRDVLKRITMLGGALMIPRVISVNSAKDFRPATCGSKCTATLGCASGYICCQQGNDNDHSNCQCELIVGDLNTCAKFGKSVCTR